MAAITIRNLDESIKTRLRIRAASHDRSMEEEARAILREALQVGAAGHRLGTLIHRRFMAAGGAWYSSATGHPLHFLWVARPLHRDL